MSAITFFIVSLILGAACEWLGSKAGGAAAIILMLAGAGLILLGGYGIFTSFI